MKGSGSYKKLLLVSPEMVKNTPSDNTPVSDRTAEETPADTYFETQLVKENLSDTAPLIKAVRAIQKKLSHVLRDKKLNRRNRMGKFNDLMTRSMIASKKARSRTYPYAIPPTPPQRQRQQQQQLTNGTSPSGSDMDVDDKDDRSDDTN